MLSYFILKKVFKENDILDFKNILKIKKSVIITLCFILFTSILVLYSSDGGRFSSFVIRQMISIAVSLIIFIFIVSLNIKIIEDNTYKFLFFITILLFIVIPFGKKTMGASRWINFGFFTIQPSEFAKIAVVLACSLFFSQIKTKRIYKLLTYIGFIIMFCVPLGLVVIQPDLATFIIIFATIAILFFSSGIPIKYIILFLFLVAIFLPICWYNFLQDYQKLRVINFLFPDNDPYGSGYNIKQSRIAIGSGGLFGKGFLKGTQGQLHFLPEHRTDFIFTIICEEFGFLGAIIVIFAYLYLIYYGYTVAGSVNSVYGKLICIGCSSLLFLHLFINVGMVIGLMPVAGIPLTMISYGGSSLMMGVLCVSLMICVDINRYKI